MVKLSKRNKGYLTGSLYYFNIHHSYPILENSQKHYLCRVKFLTLILALYILVLPCLPCTDTSECHKDSTTSITVLSGHENHPQENEICNPFCSCACCGHIVTTNFQPNKIMACRIFPQQQLQYFYENVSLSSDFFGNIWQPPKFS